MTATELVATVDEARARVTAFRAHLEDIKTLLVEMHRGRDWVALGHASWDEYCVAELGGRIPIPRDERDDLVIYLHDAGMSTRAITAAVEVSRTTVIKATAASRISGPDGQVVHFGPPENEMAAGTNDQFEAALDKARAEQDMSRDNIARHLKVEVDPPTVTGTDGKTYQATKPVEAKDTNLGVRDDPSVALANLKVELAEAQARRLVVPAEVVIPAKTTLEFRVRTKRVPNRNFGPWGQPMTRGQVENEVNKLRTHSWISDLEVAAREVSEWTVVEMASYGEGT